MQDLRSRATALWTSFRSGTDTAFRELYELTYEELYRYARRLGGQSDVLRDLIQDTYLAIWLRRDKLPPVRDPWVFLLVSVRNRIIDQSRRKRVDPVELPVVPSPEEELLAAEERQLRTEWLRQHLDRLPERQREALHLRYRLELDYGEIAELMGVGQQVVYNYVNRGVGNLRRVAAETSRGQEE